MQRGRHVKVQIQNEVLRKKTMQQYFMFQYLVKCVGINPDEVRPLSKLHKYEFGCAAEGNLREGQMVRMKNKDQKLLFDTK